MTAGTDAQRIAELEADNRRLRRLLDQRDVPGEVRHRLQNTLALLRAVVRRSADTERELADYVAHLEDRLDAVMRAQALSDQHGMVSLPKLLVDELFHYQASEGERLLLSGPDVELQPRAGQVFALVLHELAVNAVEHGALGVDGGRVEVSWSTTAGEPDTELSLVWTEWGVPPTAGSSRKGFGTEVLTRMFAYDFKAETETAFEPGMLRCTIRLPLSKQVGRVALE